MPGFRRTLDQIRDCIFIYDAESLEFSYVNIGAVEQVGYSMAELLKMHPYDIMLAYDEPRFRELIAPLLSGEVDFHHFETVHRHRDGRQIPVDILLQKIRRKNGAASFIAIVRDISERKSMEAELLENSKHFEDLVVVRTLELKQATEYNRMLFETSPIGLALCDMNGNLVDMNPAFLDLIGYEFEEARKLSYWDITPRDYETQEQQQLELLKANGCYGPYEKEYLHKDGHRIPVRLNGLVIERDAESFIWSSVEDITERKRVEAEIQEAEERYRALFSDSQDAIMTLAPPHWRFTSGNPAAVRLFGAEDEAAFIKLGPWDVSPVLQPDGRTSADKAQEVIATAMNEGGNSFEWMHSRFDGTEFPAVVLLSRVIIGGEPILQATVRNISAEKTAERALNDARIEAERLAKAKSEFLANMSHEIRTPLNAVLGIARMGLRDSEADTDNARYFEKILNSGEHLLGVINDILDYSKIEAGKISLQDVSFELVNVIHESVALIENARLAKGLELKLDIPGTLPARVRGDQQRLRQVLVNLLSNAVKFTEEGELRLAVSLHGENICFEIVDTGIGMSSDQVARLFRPFEQADTSSTRVFGGTGLGLVISNKLTEAMGGEISVKSVPGIGSTFIVSLPLSVVHFSHETSNEDQAIFTGRKLQGIRILAAEDVEINRLVVEDLLAGVGAEVEFVFNGREAVERVSQQDTAFDIVLMDVQMPEMDGYEATRKIKSIRPDLPVIGLTAHAMEEERQKCFDAGMSEHVTKPVDLDCLVLAINRCLVNRN